MPKFALSPSRIINIALGSILLVGGVVTYKFGNFGGVSFDELGEKYISKTDVKFSDLPQELQKRYIDKEATLEQSKDAASLLEDTYVDEEGKTIPESEVTKQDMKRLINKLQKTLLFLQHDNLLLTNEKNELAKKFEEQEDERESEKTQLLSKNTERLNEAEQQHYRNISDLTMKINELQKDNITAAQKANIEANTLRSQIEDLKSQAVDAEKQKALDIQKAREEEQAKLVDYKEKIKLLNDKISLLNEQINTNTDTAKNAFSRKQDEIDGLKKQLEQAAKDKNDLMAQQTQTLLSNDQKHKEEIAKYAKTIEQLKSDTEKLIAQNRQDMSDQEQDHLKKATLQEEKIKGLTNDLSSAQKHIDALMLENEKDFNKFKTYLEDEKKLNLELTQTNKKLENDAQNAEKTFNANLLKQKEELAKKENVILDLNATIAKLKSDKVDIEAEVKRRVSANDEIHNKNYKIFNEKIASFDADKKALADKYEKQLSEVKALAKEAYERLQYQNNELLASNKELKQQLGSKDQDQQALKTQVLTSKADQQKTQSMLESLQEELKQKEKAYLAKLQDAQTELKNKDAAMVAAKKDETLKIASLEKEIKEKAIDAQKMRDENSRHESALKTIQIKLKDMEDNATKTTNKQIDDLKAKLAQSEKSRASENSQFFDLKDTLRVKEIEYLDALKAKDKEIKTYETKMNASLEAFKKLTSAKQETEEQLKALKEDAKQKELQYLEANKTFQSQLKAKESEILNGKKESTMQTASNEKELKQKEMQLASANDAYQKLQTQKSALDKELAQMKEEAKKTEMQHLDALKALQSELKEKDKTLNGTQKQETLKSLALEKELQQKEQAATREKETLTQRLAAAEQTIKTLNEKLASMDASVKATNKVVANSAPKNTTKGKKPVFVDSIMCTDMGTGVNAISTQCKQAVQTFLAKYDSSYFFEVAPIVDNGGFASLKLIKSKKVGVEDSEIDRITGLANIGLGKARAKAGGDLVETYVGEGAKISYALSNIEKDKARGFEIKVYQ